MNAVVLVTTTSGKVNFYQGVTLATALSDFFAAMDSVCAEPSCIETVELFTKFSVNVTDSRVYETLVARNLADKLK